MLMFGYEGKWFSTYSFSSAIVQSGRTLSRFPSIAGRNVLRHVPRYLTLAKNSPVFQYHSPLSMNILANSLSGFSVKALTLKISSSPEWSPTWI